MTKNEKLETIDKLIKKGLTSASTLEILKLIGATGMDEQSLKELKIYSNPYLANSLLKSEGPVLTKKSSYGIANNEIIIYLALVGMIIVMTIGYIIVTIK